MSTSRVALIHTGFVLVDALTKLFRELAPEAELMHVVDDSLLREVLRDGEVRAPVRRRLLAYFQAAEAFKVDCILNVCSSVGDVADLARQVVQTPVIRIDEAMAEEAVSRGSRIGVAATLATTLEPTCRLILRKAQETAKAITLERALCAGAFEALTAGKPEAHDQIVLQGIRELAAKGIDIIVFAQGSMARFVERMDPELAERTVTSPRSGVLRVKELLERKKP